MIQHVPSSTFRLQIAKAILSQCDTDSLLCRVVELTGGCIQDLVFVSYS